MRRAPAISLLVLAVLAGSTAGAAEIDALREKVGQARSEAETLGGEIRATQEELMAAESEAEAAAAEERRLGALLADGEERSALLRGRVARTRQRLEDERRRLARARRILARRLVAIYKSGSPSAAAVILSSADFDDLATRAEYLERIESSDSELAGRVEQVRDSVRRGLRLVAQLKARVDAHNERLAAARARISAVRSEAQQAATRLAGLRAARSAALATLKERIGAWVEDIEEAEAASRAQAEETVGRWLGGPYSIPTYIVMCESGGNYGALNPSSGAGGAYQILPSTWRLYGGAGLPHEASKAEQDRIAAEIWADSGPSAWVCA